MGLRTDTPVTKPRLEVALLYRFAVPLKHAPRWRVTVDQGGVSDHRFTERGATRRRACNWSGRTVPADDGCRAELFIPYADVGGAAAVAPVTRWRVRLVLREATPNERLVVQWPETATAWPETGAIVVFTQHRTTERPM
mgnify:FL=1